MWKRTRRDQGTLSIGDKSRLKLQDIPKKGFECSNIRYESIFDMKGLEMSEDPKNKVSNLQS